MISNKCSQKIGHKNCPHETQSYHPTKILSMQIVCSTNTVMVYLTHIVRIVNQNQQ